MNITDPAAIKDLLSMGIEVRVYNANEGTFHPKIWLFQTNKRWSCIIGSANLTKAALFDNVEASIFIDHQHNLNGVIEQSLLFFTYLWNSEYAKPINLQSLENWESKLAARKKVNDVVKRTDQTTLFNNAQTVNLLLNFVKSWIDMDKDEKEDDVIGSLWRGWYIIPDQGYVDNKLMQTLQRVAKRMAQNGGMVSLTKDDKVLSEILKIVENPDRVKFKMGIRDLFIRQQKNYLMKFGFAYHKIKQGKNTLDKSILYLTSLGEELAKCKNIVAIKAVYTDFMEDYQYNGLRIIDFTRNLLAKHDYISFKEFSYFVIHAYTENELSEISQLITLYRTLDLQSQQELDAQIDIYFQTVKEPTAKGVRSNYDKKVKHTLSAIGWCEGLSYKNDKWTLQKNKI